jgi:membrane protease YdiL (CAAX protease family)
VTEAIDATRIAKLAASCGFSFFLAWASVYVAKTDAGLPDVGVVNAIVVPTMGNAAPLGATIATTSTSDEFTVLCTDLEHATPSLQTMYRLGAARIGQDGEKLLFCSITTPYDYPTMMTKTLDIESILRNAGVRGLAKGRITFSFSKAVSGVQVGNATAFVAHIVLAAVLGLAYAFFVGWREDLRRLISSSRKEPWLLAVPFAAKIAGGLLFATIGALAAARWRDPTAIDLVVLSPVIEELLFRVAIFSLVARYSNVNFGVAIATILFGYVHDYDLASTLGVMAFGLGLQYFYLRTRSILFCILCHSLGNAIVVLVQP